LAALVVPRPKRHIRVNQKVRRVCIEAGEFQSDFHVGFVEVFDAGIDRLHIPLWECIDSHGDSNRNKGADIWTSIASPQYLTPQTAIVIKRSNFWEFSYSRDVFLHWRIETVIRARNLEFDKRFGGLSNFNRLWGLAIESNSNGLLQIFPNVWVSSSQKIANGDPA
jgi:hypothetical protein